ncbi:hypothetical protein FQA39_LY03877 [Lamprigera yunnana]|nr:hypothetical protein FQA39_LY03877 [Lamprigera yunnana]
MEFLFVVIEEDNLLDWLGHVDLKKSTGLGNRYQKALTDKELLLLLENDNSDLNILSDEDDDRVGWDEYSGDEVPDENAKSAPMAPINPEVNA